MLPGVSIPVLSSLAAFAVLWALQALCYAAGEPAEQALVADLTGGDQRGRAYGFYAMTAGLDATIGPITAITCLRSRPGHAPQVGWASPRSAPPCRPPGS
jgi:MFS family permease